MKTKIIAIVGPTASGKTGLGIEIAHMVGGEVISVDSRQIYKGMDIGTAKVTGEWMVQTSMHTLFAGEKALMVDGIPHWGIDLVEPNEDYSVVEFKIFAEQKIKEIVRRKHVPILVGGTGLWVHALIDNYNLTQTAADPVLRAQLEKCSTADLFAEYKRLDPEGAELIDKDNPRRLVRALEVTKITGKPFFQQQTKGETKYDVLQIGLFIEREVLSERINTRVDEMVANGLVNEVRVLQQKYGCDIDAMTGIGYRQICVFLNGQSSLAEAIVEIKKATRQYAKHQMTWFKRDPRIVWVQTKEKALERVRLFCF